MSAHSTVSTRVGSYTLASGGGLRTSAWERAKGPFGLGSLETCGLSSTSGMAFDPFPGQREHHRGLFNVVLVAGRDDAGPDREELDHVRAPPVASLDDPGADDAAGLELIGFALHPLHGEFACLVERLGVVGHLDVAAHLLERRQHPLARDVVDAVAHDQADRPVAGPQQRGEVLPAQVAGERTAVGCAVELSAAGPDGGP